MLDHVHLLIGLRDPVIRYIENQQQHHSRKSFRQEYIELLERFDVKYDPRYIFHSSEE